jgi:hypothetical protein
MRTHRTGLPFVAGAANGGVGTRMANGKMQLQRLVKAVPDLSINGSYWIGPGRASERTGPFLTSIYHGSIIAYFPCGETLPRSKSMERIREWADIPGTYDLAYLFTCN